MSSESSEGQRLKPLEVTCSSADCQSGLHYFKPNPRTKVSDEVGPCRYCGADLVDPERIQKHSLDDVDYTFQSLKQEKFRHHMWHVEIDLWAVNYAKRKGKCGLRLAAEHRIRKHLGPSSPAFDGRQTPREGCRNPICYAQHAVAVCCRKCMEYWHGVPQNQALTEQQIAYFTDLVMLYLLDRLPGLTDQGEKVPPIRSRR